MHAMHSIKILFLLAALLDATGAQADTRHAAQRAAFMRANPCPATGQGRGTCPGHVVDHIKPLCLGGADLPENMQWQTVKEGKTKDQVERELCRALRRGQSVAD